MKRRKAEPAPMTLTFSTIDDPSEPGTPKQYFIDLSQCASLVNRRFYRQGLNWAVGSIKVITPTASNIYVHKLPSTWTLSNAWQKSFSTWQEMNNKALEENESTRPRFLDFKIYANARHHYNGYQANLLPRNVSTNRLGVITLNTVTPGEWESSKITIPVGGSTVSSTELIAVGPSYPGASAATSLNAVSLIEGYAASRGLPSVTDPNTPTDMDDAGPSATPENWMTAVSNEGILQDSVVLEDLRTENNLAPYPFEGATVGGVTFSDTMYPGGANQLPGLEIHDQVTVTATTVGGMTRIKGGSFPCGLIAITDESDAAQSIGIQIELVPGPHRGYLAMPMQEM